MVKLSIATVSKKLEFDGFLKCEAYFYLLDRFLEYDF